MIPYLILFVGTMLLSLWAMARVKSVYQRYSQVPGSSGYTGAQVAASILQRAGINDVEIVEHNVMLGDHYDPTHKRLVLSTQNYRGTSLAAIGVSAHECGHAIQHKIAYGPLHWRMAAVGITNYASQIVFWIPMIGLFGGFFSGYTAILIMAVCFGVIMLFNLITLPVEFDASRRARQQLVALGVLDRDELPGVSETLDAAALTYVAAFVASLGSLLHILMLLSGRRDD